MIPMITSDNGKRLGDFFGFLVNESEKWERFTLGEKILSRRFQLNGISDLCDIYEKVALVDRLYRTNVYDIYSIAKHITKNTIDSRLKSRDLTLVDLIRKGHGIKTKKGNERDFYSFATKYLSWHKPAEYPIFDNLIGNILRKLNENDAYKFCELKLKGNALRNYETLVSALDTLIDRINLPAFRYKKIDIALWFWAKVEEKERPEEKEDGFLKSARPRIEKEKTRLKVAL